MKEITIPNKINNQTELEQAQIIRNTLKADLKRITDEKDKVARPLLDAIAAERARFAPTIKKYEDAIKTISTMLTDYHTEQFKLQKAQEDKILSDGRLKDTTVLKKLSDIEVVETAGFRKHQVLKITDEMLIPREYLIVDEKYVLQALKDGITVPGAEIEVKLIPVSS